ncbi:hypothetical protein CBS147321_6545 [Aspergillus niger]|nr:hypothetical protein CBS147320_7171 [Aspergillus niger]KAI2939859.1 hypothetical protein CBS147321_6545 [Aspergillus niger]KAI2974050.1 hypothetical protein CBS147324_3774 [Aspergillus niger]KAI3056704.1 hypothetical protein CBS147352_2230 [Aspergillus niger]
MVHGWTKVNWATNFLLRRLMRRLSAAQHHKRFRPGTCLQILFRILRRDTKMVLASHRLASSQNRHLHRKSLIRTRGMTLTMRAKSREKTRTTKENKGEDESGDVCADESDDESDDESRGEIEDVKDDSGNIYSSGLEGSR